MRCLVGRTLSRVVACVVGRLHTAPYSHKDLGVYAGGVSSCPL